MVNISVSSTITMVDHNHNNTGKVRGHKNNINRIYYMTRYHIAIVPKPLMVPSNILCILFLLACIIYHSL